MSIESRIRRSVEDQVRRSLEPLDQKIEWLVLAICDFHKGMRLREKRRAKERKEDKDVMNRLVEAIDGVGRAVRESSGEPI